MNNLGKSYWDAHVTLSDSARQFHTVEKMTAVYDDNPLDITIFISCYNEQDFIYDTLETVVKAMELVGKSYEIIVIDDGSRDQSAELVKKFIALHPQINIIHRINIKNKGLAQNFVDAAFIGRGKYYRLICGDNAEPIDTIVSVISKMGQADMIIPYYISAEGKSLYRRSVSKLYTKIINLVSGNKINYYNGLQVHLRHNVMRWHPNTRGFGFQAGLVCLLLESGFSYIQVPCITIERRGGAGNALTLKNLRSVVHTMMGILLRRMFVAKKS
jgi:glycosyltransferase involved in cell wall biosynthesis